MKTSTLKQPGGFVFLLICLVQGLASFAQNASEYTNNAPVGGLRNAAFGYQAMRNAGGSSGLSCALGRYALYSAVNNADNIALGEEALYTETQPQNIAIGYKACYLQSGRNSATAAGVQALYQNGGMSNSAIGYQAIMSSLGDDFNTAMGSGSDVSSNVNQTAIGSGAVSGSANYIHIGDGATYAIQSQVSLFTVSDARFKENITEKGIKGMEFISKLEPVVYNFDGKKLDEFRTAWMKTERRAKHTDAEYAIADGVRQSGFLAQDVEKAAADCGIDFDAIKKPANSYDTYALAYAGFVVPLVKAVQEQQAQIDALQAKIKEQDSRINAQLQSSASRVAGGAAAAGKNYRLQPDRKNNRNIEFVLPSNTANAALAIFDLSGKRLLSLPVTGSATSLTIDGNQLAAGTYICCIVANGQIACTETMHIGE